MTNAPKWHPRPVTVADRALAERRAHGRIVLIDDDAEILTAFDALLTAEGYVCETYISALRYLDTLTVSEPSPGGPCCVLADVRMPELDGLELQRHLAERVDTPLILMSGSSGAREAIAGLRGGALDFLLKPIDAEDLLTAVNRGLAISAERLSAAEDRKARAERFAALTERERDVIRRVALGQRNQEIADALGIALRTVKLYRQHAMEKLGATRLVDLLHLFESLPE